jgi:PAS domain S-box-containing protein
MTDRFDAEGPEADTLPADLFVQVADAVAHGVYCIDVDGNATYLNPAAEALLGYSRRDLLGAPMHAAIHHTRPNGQTHPKDRCAIHLALRDGATQRTKSDIFWRADGTSFPVEYVSTPLRQGPAVVGAVVSFQDISDRHSAVGAQVRAVQERLAKAEAAAADARRLYAEAQEGIRSRDEFLSIATHELRTPVTALRGFAQLALRRLRRGTFDAERGRLVLEEIDGQSTHLTSLLDQLLDVSRLDVGSLVINREPMDLVAAVAAAVRVVQTNAEARVLVMHAPESLPAVLDATRIEQVLVSLVDNAVRFSPDGGVIDVDVSSPLPNTGQIIVRDHGPGLPAEQRDHLFDRFSQAQSGEHYWGLGLGLYLGRQITELHGGALTVEAAPGGGTRFTLLVPLQIEMNAAGSTVTAPGRVSSATTSATTPVLNAATT